MRIFFSTIARQFLVSAAGDHKGLASSKLQFIDATVKSSLFGHQGKTTFIPKELYCWEDTVDIYLLLSPPLEFQGFEYSSLICVEPKAIKF